MQEKNVVKNTEIMTQYWRLWAAHHMRVWGGYENTTLKVCEDKRKSTKIKAQYWRLWAAHHTGAAKQTQRRL